ncbi:hypothetical protein PHLCEN_2v1902 [Hermanssonia centrifuga]|uniref:Uncharacterized protein n=1 Tax=Hermanssonia centrifuga TaxID=98765 RepID=A0A2R6RVK6_9APHY|nr:hypothetical protein PHLCEN_2v1902 [Hermanssonia centrifuga]
MTLSPDYDPETGVSSSGHPYSYTRVLGIFHANVVYHIDGKHDTVHLLEFLWVRWYHLCKHWKGGFKHQKLHRLEFMDEAYGFLDPDDVIQGAHIIPAFVHGRSGTTSTGHQDAVLVESKDSTKGSDWYDYNSEWRFYYVNL